MRNPQLLLFLSLLLPMVLAQSCGSAGAPSVSMTPVPSGVDAALWRSLTGELERQLAVPHKAVSATSEQAQLTYDQASSRISWYMVHSGDYNQDGLVTVADLTPLAAHFNERATEIFAATEFPHEVIQSAIDGDGNGEINIADISPIAANFGHQLNGYHVYQSAHEADNPGGSEPNGPGAQLVSTVQLAAATQQQGERKKFTQQVVPTSITQYFWVRPFDAVREGVASNSVAVKAVGNFPPVAFLTDPSAPKTGEQILFDATESQDPDGQIVSYEWDFDGDGVFEVNAGTQQQAPYYFYSPGLYTVSLRITDDAGAQSTTSRNVEVAELKKWRSGKIDADAVQDNELYFGRLGYCEFQGQALVAYEKEHASGTPDRIIRISSFAGQSWSLRQKVSDVSGAPIWAGSADGTPVVMRYHQQPYELRFAHATDQSLTSWQESEALSLTGIVGNPTGSALLAGKLAVFVNGPEKTWIRLSDDAYGSTWNLGSWVAMPFLFDYQSSCLLSGTISSVEYRNNRDLLYRRSTDDTGLNWSSPKLINTFEPSLPAPRLAQIAGNPAVAFVNSATGTLEYCRSGDAEGTSWATPVYLSAQAGDWVDIADVDERPAIVFTDRIDQDIKFVAGNDPNGSNWGIPVHVTSDWGAPANDPNTPFAMQMESISNVPGIVITANSKQAPTYYGYY